MAPASSTWSIPNISVTPIPPNTTNTQMHVSEGPGSTPEISSKANPQSKFPSDFLLNPGLNPVVSQDPFEKSEHPTLNIPSGSQVHVGCEKIEVKLTSSENKANIKHMSHSGLTPNPVTSTNIGSPVPSTEILHHWILPQPSKIW
ncbi:hypothetical protein O181_024379 [Austropuccinia psidii MF-1]|uniref:Uncharacterized protein n=1 Tax=Austropuccinia psidii MF-1 TaxID=1389203 RepID=A0A9Q3CG63_9BASI|nr:hypothetical protein [Austropuccinia psidii MF-1]